MADKRPSGFRFRLPWLLQPAPTPSPVVSAEPPTQPPRTTEPSTQPPRTTTLGSTSTQRPPFRPPGKEPMVPASPRRSPPQWVTSPPTPTVSPKSSPPKSPITKIIEPVATQPTKETQTFETTGPSTPLQRSPLGPPMQTQSPPSPPQTASPPKSNSQTLSPSRTATQPHETTPPQPSQTRTPPRSPPPSASQPTSPLPSLSTTRPTEIITEEKYPIKSNNLVPQDDDDLAFNAKPRDVPKQKGEQTKSQKPTTTSQAPLQKEIKDNISKLINKISSTSSPNHHTNEKHTSVITLAGDNKGASMHLTSDHAIKRDSKIDKNHDTEAIVNSNVQGINNSIMFDSSVTERNPGVHLRLSHDLPNIIDSNVDDEDSMEMQRAEVNITPPQKLVYNPTFGIDDIGTSENGDEIEVL